MRRRSPGEYTTLKPNEHWYFSSDPGGSKSIVSSAEGRGGGAGQQIQTRRRPREKGEQTSEQHGGASTRKLRTYRSRHGTSRGRVPIRVQQMAAAASKIDLTVARVIGRRLEDGLMAGNFKQSTARRRLSQPCTVHACPPARTRASPCQSKRD